MIILPHHDFCCIIAVFIMKSKGHINSMKDFAARDLHALADKFSRKRNLDKLLDRKRAFLADARSTHKSEPWFWPSLGAVTLIGFGSLAIWMSTLSIPSLSTFEERASSNSTTIYDRTGEIILYDVVASAERTEVKSEYMAPVMKKAVVAAEDAKFYEHKGVRIDSTLRGVTNTVLSKLGAPVRGSGGSTITQQVLKTRYSLLTKVLFERSKNGYSQPNWNNPIPRTRYSPST
jgi:membrane peptidoglycan carboxypeptidase